MNRIIKFRFWDGQKEEYVNLASKEFKFTPDSKEPLVLAFSFSKQFIVEQYTGLKDKNGKEICEGDIFRNNINGGTWRVSWSENDAAFWVDSGVFAGCSLGEFDWDRSNRKYGFIRKNCEVIGNIHENPELLGGGQ